MSGKRKNDGAGRGKASRRKRAAGRDGGRVIQFPRPVDDADDPQDEDEPDSPFAAESHLLVSVAALRDREFDTPEELERYLESQEFEERMPSIVALLRPEETARFLAYEAAETEDPDQAMELLRDALAMDPDCVDARLVIAGLMARDAPDLHRRLESTVTVARAELARYDDEAPFEPAAAVLLTLAEASLCRALMTYSSFLFKIDQIEAAAIGYSEVVEHSPGLAAEARTLLIACHLRQNRLDEAREELGREEPDTTRDRIWGRVLERYLAGEMSDAQVAATVARRLAPEAEAYLVGDRPIPSPDEDPDVLAEPGVYIAHVFGAAWQDHPEARQWLRQLA